MTRSEHIRALLEEYAAQRARDDAELNARVEAAERHTVIATNLTATQLQERYGERVSSRLLDRSVCGVLQLRGKDLRTL